MSYINEIELNEEAMSGNAEGIFEAFSVSNGFDYDNGVKSDKISHLKIEVGTKKYKYEKVKVKVQDLKPVVTNELIAQKGGSVRVKFKNLKGKIYTMPSGKSDVNAKADSVEVIA